MAPTRLAKKPIINAINDFEHLQKSIGARTTGCGLSTSFRSPSVANSRVQLWSVSEVWLTIRTSRTMSYWKRKHNLENTRPAIKGLA